MGLSDQVLFPRPKTSMWSRGKAYLFDNPVSMLMFPNLPWLPKIRFGLAGLYLRLTRNWRHMEKYTAEAWLTKYMRKPAYDTLRKPTVIAKFRDQYHASAIASVAARICQ